MAKKKLTQQELRRIFILSAILIVVSLTAYNIVGIKSLKQGMTAEQLATTKSYGEADIGGDFTMTNQDGKRMKFSDTNGSVRLVFFGFTHCPDICPTTLLTITNVMHALGKDASKVQPVFITVDPKRDTPAVMKKYLANFYPGIIGLTGSKKELEEASNAYKAYYSAADTQDDTHDMDMSHDEHAAHGGSGDHSAHGMDMDYNVDHSGYIYIMDKNGKYLAHVQYNVPEAELTSLITPHLNE